MNRRELLQRSAALGLTAVGSLTLPCAGAATFGTALRQNCTVILSYNEILAPSRLLWVGSLQVYQRQVRYA